MTAVSIAGIGAYVPRYFLPSAAYESAWGRHEAGGINATTVPDGDEDPLTMGWAAATRALDAADRTPSDVAWFGFATTSPPVEVEDVAVRLGHALGVPDSTPHRLLVGSPRCGVDGLVSAAHAGPWRDGCGLLVASDYVEGEPGSARDHAGGAGAAALVLTEAGSGDIGPIASASTPAPGQQFRRPTRTTEEGLGISAYDRSTYRSVVTRAIERCDTDPASVDALAIQAPDGSMPYRVTDDLGVTTEAVTRGTTVHRHGDTGAAAPFLGLATACEAGADDVLLVAYGSGAGATAMPVSVGGVPLESTLEATIECSYERALRQTGRLGDEPPEGGGAYVSLPTYQRSLPSRQRLVAGRCQACDAVVFPPDGACPTCGSLAAFEEVRLEETGEVETVTVIEQGGAPPEFVPQQHRGGAYPVAIVSFASVESGSVSVPLQVTRASDPAIGDRLRTTLRRLYTQEGVPRYARKATDSREGTSIDNA